MKLTKRTLLSLLLLACLLLGGCHGAQNKDAFLLPTAFDERRTYEVTFWAKTESNVTQANIYKDAIARFEQLYPNIRVQLKLYTDYGRIYQDVITNIATNSTPHVCITYPDHIATYLTGANCVVPLDTLLTDANYGLGGREIRFDAPTLSEMIPEFLAECELAGHTYAVPYMRSTEMCYINKTYVERLGYTLPDVLTWDFIWEVSQAAMAKGEDGNYLVNGQPTLIPFIYKSTDNMMIQLLRQMGAGYSNAAGEVLLFNDDARAVLKTVAENVRLGTFSTFQISSYPANWLNVGQCIFAVDSTAGSTWMGSDAPLIDVDKDKMVDFETAVRIVPQVDPAHPQMISQGPSICVFNKDDPQEVLAAWIFVQYLLSNDVQLAYASTEGYVPVTTKAQQSPEYQDYLSRSGEDNGLHYAVKLDATRLLIQHVGDTFVTPVFNGSASLRDAAGQMIEEVAKGIRRKKVVDDAFIDELYKKMVNLYRLDQINPQGTAADSTSARADLGPLPGTAIALLAGLAVVWLGIIAYVVSEWARRKKRSKCR
ncbi:MAG: extracellular solute-binding protein [Clostridiales bacterium]|nr:extracellular solute-binding protein [Clostridiales bacterium]